MDKGTILIGLLSGLGGALIGAAAALGAQALDWRHERKTRWLERKREVASRLLAVASQALGEASALVGETSDHLTATQLQAPYPPPLVERLRDLNRLIGQTAQARYELDMIAGDELREHAKRLWELVGEAGRWAVRGDEAAFDQDFEGKAISLRQEVARAARAEL
jgi:hypothetical protein